MFRNRYTTNKQSTPCYRLRVKFVVGFPLCWRSAQPFGSAHRRRLLAIPTVERVRRSEDSLLQVDIQLPGIDQDPQSAVPVSLVQSVAPSRVGRSRSSAFSSERSES